MANPVPISLVYEDELSGAVLQKILPESFQPVSLFQTNGITKITNNIAKYNGAAIVMPYLVLIDLDRESCAPGLIAELFPHGAKHTNLIFRVAVREVETWLLADHEAFARFAGISRVLIPDCVDDLSDPKQVLMNLIRRSNRKRIKESILPRQGSTAQIGRSYNGALVGYVVEFWRPDIARKKSNSLHRAMTALETFCPKWPT